MALFASKPAQENRDPKPYVTYANERRTDIRNAEWDMQSDGATEYVRVFEPRPEFGHVQHNKPNPILTVFRESRDWGYPQEFIEGFMLAFRPTQDPSPEGMHAYKVFQRLEALYRTENK